MHVTEEATHGVAPTLRATLEKAVKGSPVARKLGGAARERGRACGMLGGCLSSNMPHDP